MTRERLNVWAFFDSSIIGTQGVEIIELGLDYSGIRREISRNHWFDAPCRHKKRKRGL